jgi:hypothetical protein
VAGPSLHHPVDPSLQHPRIEAVVSAGMVTFLPAMLWLEMTVGGMLGVPSADPNPPFDYWLRSAIWAAIFFAPFVVGALLGWHAIRSRLPSNWFVVAVLGIVVNVGVIALALLFLAGEAVGPH